MPVTMVQKKCCCFKTRCMCAWHQESTQPTALADVHTPLPLSPHARGAGRSADGFNCMWGLRISQSQDVLVTGFNINTECATDIGVLGASSGVVIESGVGDNLAIALLEGAYGTLVTDVDVGLGACARGVVGSRALGVEEGLLIEEGIGRQHSVQGLLGGGWWTMCVVQRRRRCTGS